MEGVSEVSPLNVFKASFGSKPPGMKSIVASWAMGICAEVLCVGVVVVEVCDLEDFRGKIIDISSTALNVIAFVASLLAGCVEGGSGFARHIAYHGSGHPNSGVVSRVLSGLSCVLIGIAGICACVDIVSKDNKVSREATITGIASGSASFIFSVVNKIYTCQQDCTEIEKLDG